MTWLKEYTNRDEAYWMARVQNLIATNTIPSGDGHGETDLDWIYQLIEEVVGNLPPQESMPYDGNMRMAASLSAIFGLWYAQVHHAKTFDSNRPSFIRQEAYKRRMLWVNGMIKNMIDFTDAPTYFPGQSWSFPFDPTVKSGEFL